MIEDLEDIKIKVRRMRALVNTIYKISLPYTPCEVLASTAGEWLDELIIDIDAIINEQINKSEDVE